MNINLTLIGQAITFAIFVWFTMKFVWPPIMAALDERENKIADGLAAARRGEETLEQARHDATTILQEAKTKAAEIIEQANRRASGLVDEAKVQAREEGDRIVAAAKSEVEQMSIQARETLKRDVAKIAVLGAERVLERSIQSADHEALLDNLAANM